MRPLVPSCVVSDDPRFAGVPLNLRCSTFGDPSMGIVMPVDRYATGFLGLRRDPRLLVVGAIVGIPTSLESSAEAGDFATVLAGPEMQYRPNAMATNVEPSCVTADGVAYPPRRFTEVASRLDASGVGVSLSSICAPSFEPATTRFVERIARVFPIGP